MTTPNTPPGTPPATPPAGTPPAAPTPPAPPAGTPPATPPTDAPFAVFHTAEQFNERLARETRKQIAELTGTKDADELKTRLAKAAELEAAEEKRKKDAMSEIERANAIAAENEAKAKAAQSRAEELQREKDDTVAMLKLGVGNEAYARWLLAQERSKHPAESGPFDAEKALAELLKKPEHVAALKPGAPPKPTGANTDTTPGRDNAPPATPPPEGGVDAKTMTPEAWEAHKRSLGIT